MTDTYDPRRDYELSCIYGTRAMRLARIAAGEFMPRPSDPEEMQAHREYLERQLEQVRHHA